MCGITGFVGQTQDAEGVLARMMARIVHRGPDGEGTFLDGPAALGHRRLSIIDLSNGRQPMQNEDATVTVVFNGEIYNYRPLREELLHSGHIFRSECDTEVLLHGYEQWGSALPAHLRGMFAFAIWDGTAQKLFCARDPFGIKPLYYYYSAAAHTLLFGSEIKCFLPHPAFQKEIHLPQLALYLSYQYSPGEDTFFEHVKKLLPAHWLSYENGQLTVQRYWQPAFCPEEGRSLGEWADEIHGVMQNSVAAHKISDVPVASFLSSGLDSTYIAALSDLPTCYTVGYATAGYSEAEQAGRAAGTLHMQDISCNITADQFWSQLGRIQYYLDEPLGDASCVALYYLTKQAAQQVKVCLSGEGADEFFGGYNTYSELYTMTWYNRLPQWMRASAGSVARRFPPCHGLNFLARRGLPLDQSYIGVTNLMHDYEKKHVLRAAGEIPPYALAAPYLDQQEGLDQLLKMELCDINLWMVGDILLKADKMSMANSLEVRVPYIDTEVFEVARRIPACYRANAHETKIALRQAAGEILPPELTGRRKLGFPVPVRAWLGMPEYAARVREMFRSTWAGQFFDRAALEHMLDKYLAGQTNQWRNIWCVYSFLLWYEQFFILA